MLSIKSNEKITSGAFAGLDLQFENVGLVFICGKKESNSKELMKLLGGITYNPNIEITIDDFVLNNEKLLDEYRLNNVGFVFGNSQVIDNQTVLTNILSSCSLFVENMTDEYIDSILSLTGLLDKKDLMVSELSEYELHCLDIARSLVKNPKIIIANNPIARLNDEECKKLWNLVKEISKNYLVVVGNALQQTALNYADTIIAFNFHVENHRNIESIEVKKINEIKNISNDKIEITKKSSFSFARLLKISSGLLKNAIFLITIMALTFTLFLYSSSVKSNSHLKFAKSLQEENITTAIITRNTEREDYSISEELRSEVTNYSSEISIHWGNYFLKELSNRYASHSLATKYNYPTAIFPVASDATSQFTLIHGAWDNSETGIYISETDATNYQTYFNQYASSTLAINKPLHDAYLETYPEGFIINDLSDLVGEYLLFAFANNEYFKKIKVAGIFEDNEYNNNLVITDNYIFPEGYDKNKFYSVGIVTLSNNPNVNAGFFDKYASVIRDERERVYIATELDSEYAKLYNKVNKVPGYLNLATLIFLLLTVGGSYLFSHLLIATYRKELTLSRTYGLSKKEIIKIAVIKNTLISVIATVLSLVITFIAIAITNAIIKANHSFIVFSFFTIPLHAYLIVLGTMIILTAVFTGLSIKALLKKDYIIY